MRRGDRSRQRGFTYLGLLIAVAVIAIGLSAASEVWVTIARRERVVHAEWAASQIVVAIGSYYESSPAGHRVYPAELSALLEDKRSSVLRRHLRAMYANPLATDGQWELIRGGDGNVRGVRLSAPWDHAQGQRDLVYVAVAGA